MANGREASPDNGANERYSPLSPATVASGSHRSYVVVFVGLASQILLQFLLSVILARFFGASTEMDAYRAALTLPVGVSALLAGSIGPILIAIIARGDASVDNHSFTGAVLTTAALVSVLLATAGSLLSKPLMVMLLPNFSPAEIALTARLFCVLVWLIPANTLIGLFQSLLNASLVFSVPAVAGILGPLLTVSLVASFGDAHGVLLVAMATVAGAVLNLAIQFPSVIRRTAIPRTLRAWTEPRRMFRLAGPVFLGMLILKIDPLVDRYVSSFLPTGSIARLDWSYQVVTIFIVLASGTLSTVAFPRIVVQAGRGGVALHKEIARTFRTLATLCMPAVAALVVFATPIVRDIFERGEFTAVDTAMVATLVRIYALLLIGASLGELCTKTMYALHDSVTPTIISCLALGMAFVAKFSLVPASGVWMLASITAACYMTGSICQLATLRWRTSSAIFHGLPLHLGKCTLATSIALSIGGLVLTSGIVAGSIVGLVFGAGCYFGVLALLDAETRFLLRFWNR